MSLIDRAAARSQPKPAPAGRRPHTPESESDDDFTRAFTDAPPRPAKRPQAAAPRPGAKAQRPPQIGDLLRPQSKKAPQPQPAAPQKRKVRTSSEFEIDFERLSKFGFITPEARRSRVSEEFRLIKRRLMRQMSLTSKAPMAKKRRGREHVILVTSARPSEGKSFIAVNLALSIILDEGFNVMLVDADVARPSISNIFGLRNDLPGLTDLLLGEERRLSRVLLREKTRPLSLMAAGSAVASATDLFGGDDMRQLVDDIASRYTDRIIIFDAPPLLASTEPVALAEHAGQVVLVVDAERTSRAAIDSALDLLETDENVNLVLNKTVVRSRTEQFGSYYDAYNQAAS